MGLADLLVGLLSCIEPLPWHNEMQPRVVLSSPCKLFKKAQHKHEHSML